MHQLFEYVLGQKRSTLQFPRNITKLAFAIAKECHFFDKLLLIEQLVVKMLEFYLHTYK